MPAYTNPKRIFKYSGEFKIKAVQWILIPNVMLRMSMLLWTSTF